jgi:hypothetical protein
LPNGKALADHAREEHLQVKKDLYELDKTPIDNGDFSTMLKKIMDELNHHIEEEETQLIPLFRKNASSEVLQNLAKEWYTKQKLVPTRPHPDAPDRPPMETVAGLMAAPLDKAKDLMRDFPEEVKKSG